MAETSWEREVARELGAHQRQADRAIGAWGQRWDGIIRTEQMHAQYSGLESSLVPTSEWTTEQRWTEKPLEGKITGLADMLSNLAQRIDRMQANNDIETMDAGVYWETAFSQHAAELNGSLDGSREDRVEYGNAQVLAGLNDRLDDLQQDQEPDQDHTRTRAQEMEY